VLCAHRPSTEVVPFGARVDLRAHPGRVAVYSHSQGGKQPGVRLSS
jgi:hypothetical protein